MKFTRKLLALVLATMLVLAMSVTAFAASDGSITINNATVGQTYTIYKVFDATSSGSNVAYTYTKGENDLFYDALTGVGSPFTLSDTSTTNVYNVSTNVDVVAISSWLTQNKNLLTQTGDAITATSQTVQFSNLDYGYYYITSSLGSVVTINSAAKDVTVQDKNQEPGKPDEDGYKIIVDENGNKVTDNSGVNFGDTVYYVLQAKATNYDGEKQITKYVAHDVLGRGLTNPSVTKVTVGTQELTSNDYTVSYNNTDNCTLEVAINWVNSNTDENQITTYSSKYDANTTIKIYVQATVTNTATIGPDAVGQTSNLTNTGWFTWQDTNGNDINDPDQEKTTVTSHTYAIAIYKTDAQGNPLSGAEFEITDKTGAKIPVTGTAGVYEYDPTDYTGEDKGEPNYTVVSPDSGIIIVKGINAAGAYEIHETKAPAGYNVLGENITVNASELTSSTTTTTIYKDENGNITKTETTDTDTITFDVAVAAVNVVNEAGTTLPSTGGMGTTLFYIIGGVLVLAAVVLLVTKKRLSADR